MPDTLPYLARHRGPNWGLLVGLGFCLMCWSAGLSGMGAVANVYATKGEHSFRRVLVHRVDRKVEHVVGALTRA